MGVFDKADNRGFLIRFVNERDFCLANNGISRRVPALRELGATLEEMHLGDSEPDRGQGVRS